MNCISGQYVVRYTVWLMYPFLPSQLAGPKLNGYAMSNINPANVHQSHGIDFRCSSGMMAIDSSGDLLVHSDGGCIVSALTSILSGTLVRNSAGGIADNAFCCTLLSI